MQRHSPSIITLACNKNVITMSIGINQGYKTTVVSVLIHTWKKGWLNFTTSPSLFSALTLSADLYIHDYYNYHNSVGRSLYNWDYYHIGMN